MPPKTLVEIYNAVEARRGTFPEFCLDRICTTCGCWEIREELFIRFVEERGIDPVETGTLPHFRSICNIRTLDVLHSAIYYFCDCLNELTEEETLSLGVMSRQRVFPDKPEESLIFFIVMEIWDALQGVYEDRKQALATLKRRVKNPMVLKLIFVMDSHYLAAQRRRYPISQGP